MLKYAGIIALSNKKVFDDDTLSVVFVDEDAIRMGQKIVEHNSNQFEKLHEKWMTYTQEKEHVTENTTRIAMKYLAVIEERKLVSQQELAFAVGNPGRNRTFYSIVQFLIDSGCIKVFDMSSMPNIAANIKNKGKDWMDKHMISPNFRNPPTLYTFAKPLTI